MPADVNNIFATDRCALAGKLARSIGHHAPDAPKPAIVCLAAALTRTTGSFAGVGTDASGAAIVVAVGRVVGVVCADEDEHAVATTAVAISIALTCNPRPARIGPIMAFPLPATATPQAPSISVHRNPVRVTLSP